MSKTEEKMELISWEGTSFMGINKADSVFIDFSQMKKGERWVKLEGPKGAKKSSSLMGIAHNIGAELALDKKRLFNSIDNDLSETLIGKKGKNTYKVEASASRFVVKKEAGDDKWTVDSSDTPTALIKELFGEVGMFDPSVQLKKGRAQIEYFQALFASGDEAGKKMAELEKDYDKKFADRRDTNRDAKALKGALDVEPLFQNREGSEKRFAKPINANKEKAKFDELSEKKNAYDQYKNTLAIAEAGLVDTNAKIADLERQLAAQKELKEKQEGSVKKGNDWVTANASIVEDYDKANSEWLNLSKTLAEQEKWKGIVQKEKEYNTLTEKSTNLTADLDKLEEDILKLTNRYLPKIKGLTAKVATGIDKKDKPEGMFYQVPGKDVEQPLHELSETEYADMWCQIFAEQEVQFIFIENLPNFGDTMIKTLNQFVKNGGYVFYTEQNRQQKDLTISFEAKVV